VPFLLFFSVGSFQISRVLHFGLIQERVMAVAVVVVVVVSLWLGDPKGIWIGDIKDDMATSRYQSDSC